MRLGDDEADARLGPDIVLGRVLRDQQRDAVAHRELRRLGIVHVEGDIDGLYQLDHHIDEQAAVLAHVKHRMERGR